MGQSVAQSAKAVEILFIFGNQESEKAVVRLEEETSNRLFETLEEWNDYLKRYVPAFKEPAP